jgi:putative acetyltransferase
LVAVCNGVIAGFADMDKSGYLDRLFVNKDYQGVGIATALVTELERRVGQNSAVCFKTCASVTAKPLFEKLGYTVQAENIAVRRGVSLVNFRMAKVISET